MPERVIPVGALPWLPESKRPDRVVLHWTGGGYKPSAFDLSHYHWLIDGQGRAHRGLLPIGRYNPPWHTRALNTRSVGLSICAMAGAVEGRTPYRVPVTVLQWERAAQAAAEILHHYGLPVSERTILSHSEVGRVYGKIQRGKWDVDCVAGIDLSPRELHGMFRRKVQWYWDRLENEEPRA